MLAVCEINAYLFVRYFVHDNGRVGNVPTLLKFRRTLACQLIRNNGLSTQEMEGGGLNSQLVQLGKFW